MGGLHQIPLHRAQEVCRKGGRNSVRDRGDEGPQEIGSSESMKLGRYEPTEMKQQEQSLRMSVTDPLHIH